MALLTLTNCATHSESIDLPPPPKPLACDPAIVAYYQERPAIKGAIPQARTAEQESLLEQFLLSVRGIIDFGNEADRIATLAKQECIDRVSG